MKVNVALILHPIMLLSRLSEDTMTLMPRPATIRSTVLGLPPRRRAALAHDLIRSLDADHPGKAKDVKTQATKKRLPGKRVSLGAVLPPGALPTRAERARASKILKDVAAGKIRVRYV
jgi:hypothetical protein